MKRQNHDAPVCLYNDLDCTLQPLISKHRAIGQPFKLEQPGEHANFVEIAKAWLFDGVVPLSDQRDLSVAVERLVESVLGLLTRYKKREGHRREGYEIPYWKMEEPGRSVLRLVWRPELGRASVPTAATPVFQSEMSSIFDTNSRLSRC
jgi:hypothetical protein